MLCQALESHHQYVGTLDEALHNFIDDVAGTLAYYGEAFYEIVYFYNVFPQFLSFGFEKIPNWDLKNGIWSYTQYQPLQIHGEQDKTIKKIKISKKDVVHFKISDTLYSLKNYKRILKKLAILGNLNSITRFLSPEEQRTGFDFERYHTEKILHVARLTRKIGWHARQSYTEHINEFYLTYRYLLFQLYRAKLREYIIETLNKALEKVRKKIDFPSNISVKGIPMVTDIERTIKDLIEGKIEFVSALNNTKID